MLATLYGARRRTPGRGGVLGQLQLMPELAWSSRRLSLLSSAPSSGKLSLPALLRRSSCADIWAPLTSSSAVVGETEVFCLSQSTARRCTSFPALRDALRHKLANAIAPKLQALTVLGGDFNYVIEDIDRRALTTASTSGRRDHAEESHFQRFVAHPHGLFELYQPEFTFASTCSRSRIDRLYANHHVAEQLDKHMLTAALEWKPEISSHRAVFHAKRSSQHLPQLDRAASDRAVRHPDFPRRVALRVQEEV